MKKLAVIEDYQKDNRIDFGFGFQNTLRDLVHLTGSEEDGSEGTSTQHMPQLLSLKQKLDLFEEKRLKFSAWTEVLKSLYFPAMPNRFESIPEAGEFTNDWLFDTSFADWLREKGGYYWIKG